jgi:hypothetical protein
MTSYTNLVPRGVYFGMPFEEYLADQSLSASGIKWLQTSPMTYWAGSWMNPNAEDRETVSKALGTAVHKRILEGKQEFEKSYVVLPDRADHPEAIDGGDALREECGALGLKKSGTIAEMCDRILDANPGAQLWPVILGEAKARAEAHGAEIIKPSDYRKAEMIASMIESHSKIRHAFIGGFPEVSVFWTDPETGVPLKARFDYLKDGLITDLKSFSNQYGAPVGKAVASAVARYQYHIQATLYLQAASVAASMMADGQIHIVDDDQEDRVLGFVRGIDSNHFRYFWVFVETGPGHNVLARRFRADLGGGPSLAWQSAREVIQSALATYKTCLEEFGTSPWAVEHPITDLVDEDLPSWMMEDAA